MRFFHCLKPIVLVSMSMLFILSGCTKPPDEELAAAKAAIKDAKSAEADKYMPNNFKNLKKALASAEAEIALQNSNFFLSRNYSKAKQLLRNTTDLAKQVTADAPKAKADMIAQVENGLTTAKKLAKETRVDIKKAPRSKGKKVIAQMKKDLKIAENELSKASTEFSSGNILGAWKNLTKAQQLLKKIFDQLSTSGTDGLM